MLRFPRALPDRLLNPTERLQRETQDLRFQRQECRKKLKELKHGVAVVGGGFAGVMAAWELSQHGVKVTVYEAHNEVGGRVRSNPTWSEGRITEEGAELIGSFHTQWLGLARQYGLAMISRMDSDLYHRAGLDVRLTLDQPLSMPEFEQLSKAMEKRILRPIALLALGIRDPSRPWKQRTLLTKFDGMSVQDALPKFCPIAKRTKGNKDERLWKMIEFKLVNDEVAPLDEMNFLGLLCKVRAGQGERFGAGLKPILMGYWDELEIFRCADGCQQLAKEMITEISQKDGKIWPSTMVKGIDIAKEHVTLTWVPVRNGKPDAGSGQSERFDFVIFAIPPSVWYRVTILEHDRKVDPTVEIGEIGMAPAVKFFSDVKERFWIKKGAAPYGGSLKIGQVWEGTDNQTLVEVQKCDPKRREKQGIVLSVFAGPLLPGPRVPTEKEFKDELPKLYNGYPAQAKTLFANWPAEDFIETGYVNPKIGQLLDIGEKLSKPFHDRLFFAGEHTQMDFFGYMEGALSSGERAAHTLMLKACGLLDQPAPKAAGRPAQTPAPKPSGPQLVARATPTREAPAVQREMGFAMAEHSSTGHPGEAESPFLLQELFADSSTEEFEPRVAALVAESPFAGELDERRRSFDEEELTEGEVLDEFEEAEELEPGKNVGEVEDEQEDDSVDDERALLREDETELESPEGLEELYGHAHMYEPGVNEEIDLEDTDHEFGLADEWDADENCAEAEEEIEEPELELEEVADEREDEDKYVQLLTKDDAARHGDPRRELEEREAPAPGFESQTGTDKTTFAPKATDRFIILVSGYNYRDHNDDYDELTRNRARLIASKSKFKTDDKLVFVWFSVTAGRVFVNRRTKGVWKLKNTADWTPIDEFKFNDAHSQSFSFEAIDRTKHYGTGKTFRQNSANTVMSIVNVYEFITNLGRHRTGTVMELSIIGHGYWNGPILVNSSDNAASGSAGRDPSDKDGRGRKDFLEDNIDTTLVHDAFHVVGFSWIWGCFAAQAPLAVIQGVADSRFKKTPRGKRVKGVDGAVYQADGKTPDTATFLFSLGKNQTELFSKEWDASFFPTGMESFKKTFGEIKEFAKKHSDDTYCRSLTIASDKPCYGPPLGASTNYAAKDPYRLGVPVIHWVERGKKRPPPESGFEANYDATINFFVKSMSMPEDPEKRGYVRYSL